MLIKIEEWKLLVGFLFATLLFESVMDKELFVLYILSDGSANCIFAHLMSYYFSKRSRFNWVTHGELFKFITWKLTCNLFHFVEDTSQSHKPGTGMCDNKFPREPNNSRNRIITSPIKRWPGYYEPLRKFSAATRIPTLCVFAIL